MLKYYNLVLFVFASFCCIYALFGRQQSKQLRIGGMAELIFRWEKPVLILIALLAVTIRVWQFGSVPGGVNQDGAMAAVDANALANYGTDRYGTHMPAHLTAWGYGQMSSLMSYLMVPWIWLFGLNTVTMRLPNFIMSLAGGVFFWLFARKAFGKAAGLIAAFFCAINPWHFMQSRWALDCNLFPHFFVIAVCLLYFSCNGKKASLYLSMIFFGLCMYCYGISIYTVPVFLVLACVYLLKKGLVNPKQTVFCVLLYLAVSWPFYLTMAINAFGWESIEFPFVTCQLFSGSVRSNDILLFSKHPLAQLWENLKCLLNVTVLQKKDYAWNDISGFGTMYLFSMPFAVCGIVSLAKRRKELGSQFLIFMLITGIVCGCLTNSVNVNRMNIIYYPIMLLIVLGIDYVISGIPLFSLPVFACYVLSAVLLVGNYFGSYAEEIRHSFYYGFGEALTAAEETGSEKIYISADTQYTGSKNVSTILTMFYDQTDAEYFQGKTNINNGKACLPFSERFQFVSFSRNSMPARNGQTVCVIRKQDISLFSENYDITVFGDYALAVSKQ